MEILQQDELHHGIRQIRCLGMDKNEAIVVHHVEELHHEDPEKSQFPQMVCCQSFDHF